MKTLYGINTEGAVALSAATAKSVLGVKAPSGNGVQIRKFTVGFDGVTYSAVPVLVELCYCTFATNSPGTNSTSVTVVQKAGRVITAGATGAKTWTAEPTTITVIEPFLLTPAGGLVIHEFSLGNEPDCAVSEGFVLRLTAPATVNVRASMEYERM